MYAAVAALLGGVLISGATPIFVRVAETDPAATGFWRMALSLPLLLLIPAGAAGRASPRDLARVAVGGAAYGADLAVWYWAILLTSVVNAQLFAFSYPLLVALFAALVLGHRLGWRSWGGVALSVGGAAAVILGRGTAESGNLLGDGLALLAAGFYSVTLLMQSEARKRMGTRAVLAVSSLASAALLLPVALLAPGAFLPSSAEQWLLLGGFALSAQTGQFLVIHALGRLPVTFAAVTGGLYVVVGAVLAWGVLGEALGAAQIVGVVAVLTGIALTERRTTARPAPATLASPAGAIRAAE
jgi:drug/metabolite transporter (DMT)-like permease